MNVAPEIKVEAQVESDELWFKDAIFYQLHVKSFADSNGDGIGDACCCLSTVGNVDCDPSDGVDIGDFSGQVILQLQNGGVTNLVIPNTINGPGGSVLFFGFYDTVADFDVLIVLLDGFSGVLFAVLRVVGEIRHEGGRLPFCVFAVDATLGDAEHQQADRRELRKREPEVRIGACLSQERTPLLLQPGSVVDVLRVEPAQPKLPEARLPT